MPTYTVEIDGHTYDLEGDHEPTEAEARAAIGGSVPTAPETTPRASTGKRVAGVDFVPDAEWDNKPFADKLRGVLTAAGTVAGTMLGIPPDAAREKVDHPKTTLAEFAVPGLIEKASGPVMAGAKMLYRSVLKPSKAIQQATIGGVTRAGGTAATDVLVENGIPITRSGAGLARAEALRGQSRQAADKLIADWEAGHPGVTIPAAEAMGDQAPVMNQALNVAQLGKPSPVPGVLDRAKAFLDMHPEGLTPTLTQTLKRAAQTSRDAAYKAAERGQVIDDVGTLFDQAQASGMRQALQKRVPGLEAQNVATQRLAAGARAIGDAEGRIANRNWFGMGDALSLGAAAGGASVAGPEGVLAGVLTEALTRPEIASRIAIQGFRAGSAMRDPAVQRALQILMASHQGQR